MARESLAELKPGDWSNPFEIAALDMSLGATAVKMGMNERGFEEMRLACHGLNPLTTPQTPLNGLFKFEDAYAAYVFHLWCFDQQDKAINIIDQVANLETLAKLAPYEASRVAGLALNLVLTEQPDLDHSELATKAIALLEQAIADGCALRFNLQQDIAYKSVISNEAFVALNEKLAETK